MHQQDKEEDIQEDKTYNNYKNYGKSRKNKPHPCWIGWNGR